jgi:hypothetical protein
MYTVFGLWTSGQATMSVHLIWPSDCQNITL